MPFMQMENISHFLRACESPPLNLPSHDRFLTVDLYESKDPAQVLQCLGAFSRVANKIDPSRFPSTIGPKKAGALSPTPSGSAVKNGSSFRPSIYGSPAVSSLGASPKPSPVLSPSRTGRSVGGREGAKSPTGPVSSWSKRSDEGNTAPAWNIHQYGYMGGASQGNQGIAFGARRQITSASPHVPNAAEKERKRREKEEEEQRLRLQAEEAERKRRVEREAEEERERVEEERRWEEETRRHREAEKKRLEEQKRQWEEQERRWKIEEEARLKEEAELQRMQSLTSSPKMGSDSRLKGQFLSQYQAEQGSPTDGELDTPEKRRVRELEKQLEEAKERERQYQLEREERMKQQRDLLHNPPKEEADTMARPPSPKESEASWAPDEREYLRSQWQTRQQTTPSRAAPLGSARPLPSPGAGAPRATPFARPLPDPKSPPLPSRPQEEARSPPLPSRPPQDASHGVPTSPRPLPDLSAYQPAPTQQSRTDRFLASNPAPAPTGPRTHQPAEMGYTSSYEHQTDTDRRIASQQKTKAGGWASKSLLEREMERERERQKEWEAKQQETSSAARDLKEGPGGGQTWDVNQYGYMGGDSQNKGSSAGSGINIGGGRRQIIGPRPPR